MTWPIFLQDNRFADAIPVASSTGSGSAANVGDLRSYTYWSPSVLPAALTVDCGTPRAVDAFAVFGHDLGSSGCTVELHGSTDNFGVSDVLVATMTPASDKPFLMTFASASYRYWRIDVTGGAVMPTLAIACAGAGLYMPSGVAAGFDPTGRSVNGTASVNDNGQPLGRIINWQSRQQTMNFRVTTAWLRSTFEPAWDAGLKGSPVLLAWDNVNYPDEVLYVALGDKFSAPHEAGPNLTLTFDVMGAV